MKILRVAPDIYPHMVGEFGIHIHEMSKEQVRPGHNVTVYAASEGVESAFLNFGFSMLIFVVLSRCFDFCKKFMPRSMKGSTSLSVSSHKNLSMLREGF